MLDVAEFEDAKVLDVVHRHVPMFNMSECKRERERERERFKLQLENYVHP